MVAETQNYLELDINSVLRILESSKLNVDSKVEVYDAAERRLGCDFENRSKYVKDLTLKVRLRLLSDGTLKYLLKKSTPVSKISSYAEILNKSIHAKDNESQKNCRTFCSLRQCDQGLFNILLCGGFDKKLKSTKAVFLCDTTKFKFIKKLPPMKENRYLLKAVCLKQDVFVFRGIGNDDVIMSVEMYSQSSRSWQKVAEMHDERKFVYAKNLYFRRPIQP